MSTAVLRIRNPNGFDEPSSYRPKARARETDVQETLRLLSEGEVPNAYIELIATKTGRRARGDEGQPSNSEGQSSNSEWLWTAATLTISGIIVIGAVVGYLIPGPMTGIILPIGIGLWWLLYKVADHADQRT